MLVVVFKRPGEGNWALNTVSHTMVSFYTPRVNSFARATTLRFNNNNSPGSIVLVRRLKKVAQLRHSSKAVQINVPSSDWHIDVEGNEKRAPDQEPLGIAACGDLSPPSRSRRDLASLHPSAHPGPFASGFAAVHHPDKQRKNKSRTVHTL